MLSIAEGAALPSEQQLVEEVDVDEGEELLHQGLSGEGRGGGGKEGGVKCV
jgi:hypothetical protein